MKKFLTFSLAAAMTLGFAACSSQDLPQPVQIPDDEDGSFVQLKFTFPDVTSRGEGEEDATTTDPAYTETESSGDYSQGYAYECNIKHAYLYFFVKNEDGTYSNVKIGDNPYKDVTVYKVNSNSTTSEASSAANGLAVSWNTVSFALPQGISEGNDYRVYALINRPVENVTTEDDLLNSTLDFDPVTNDGLDRSESNGKMRVNSIDIPMSARSYDGTVYQEFTPDKKYTKTSPAILSFEVERSYARITFKMTTTMVPLYESITSTNDENGSTCTETNKIGYLDLFAYRVVNKEQEFYTYRHVGNITANDAVLTLSMPNSWTANLNSATNAPVAFGPATTTNPYIIDPYTDQKPISNGLYTGFTNLLSQTKKLNFAQLSDLTTSQFTELEKADKDGDEVDPVSIEYVPENTMYKAAQRKGQSTGIIFAAKINPIMVDGEDESQNTQNPVGFQTWQENKSYYYYKGMFYTTLDKLMEKTKLEGVTNDNLATYGIRYFHRGIVYFEYYIRHVNNYDYTTMGEMEFGIVRNNSYDLVVKAVSIAGAYTKLPGGDPDPDPNDTNPDPGIDPEPSPDPNDDDESVKIYMEVNVKVRPWVVRANDIVIL
jgi:hypothetical protein